MKITEFYKTKQGRPYSSPSADPWGGGGLPPHSVHGVHLAGEFSSTNRTENYTAGDEMVILVDTSGSSVTINLPVASTYIGHVYWIKKVDDSGNSVTIDGDGVETIDGEASIALTLQYQYVMLICNGTNWFILGGEYVKMEDILLKIANGLEATNTKLGIIALQLEQITDEKIKESDIEED